MNITNLEKFYKSFNEAEQKDLISYLNRINLAIQINPEKDFIEDIVSELFEKYPEIKQNL